MSNNTTTISDVNSDIDEQQEGVSYEKGREFEEQFAKFLKNELNWHKVRVGAHMTGKNNAKGTSIDVFAERLDELGKKYRKIAIWWMIAAAALSILSLVWFIEKLGQDGLGFLIISTSLVIAALIFGLLSEINNKQNAWVECKNLKSRATVSHINKMLNEYNDFKASKNDEHRFTHFYFASANGYVENALKMAIDNNIVCYKKNGNTFEEVKYWS